MLTELKEREREGPSMRRSIGFRLEERSAPTVKESVRLRASWRLMRVVLGLE